MNWYEHKSSDLPRFIYRRALQNLGDARSDGEVRPAIEALCQELTTFSGDYRKLKFHLPAFLNDELNDNERQLIQQTMDKMHDKMRNRLDYVYPHCSDEFSMSRPFLMNVLGLSRMGGINKSHKCFTLGSCFAQNIAKFLNAKGFTVNVLPQTEDMNSPFSNVEFLQLCTVPPVLREELIYAWLCFMFPGHEAKNKESAADVSAKMETHKATISEADVVVLTLGNNLDFFGEAPPAVKALMADQDRDFAIAPKLLGFMNSEDVDYRMGFAKHLIKHGFSLRPGTFAETRGAVEAMLGAVRHLNNTCKIFVTVSPVPIDSAVGLADTDAHAQSAIQLDCQSKSQLRCIVEEITREGATPFTYFPSFEVVRWIAPMVEAPIFGAEDASSRHVSSDILQAIFDLFMECHCDV